MQVLIKSRHPKAAGLCELTESRVRFVRRRLRWLVPRAACASAASVRDPELERPLSSTL